MKRGKYNKPFISFNNNNVKKMRTKVENANAPNRKLMTTLCKLEYETKLEQLGEQVDNGSPISLIAGSRTLTPHLIEKGLYSLAIREDSIINEKKPHLPDDFVSDEIVERHVVDYALSDVTWSVILRDYLKAVIELMEKRKFKNFSSWTKKEDRYLEEARRELDRILYSANA